MLDCWLFGSVGVVLVVCCCNCFGCGSSLLNSGFSGRKLSRLFLCVCFLLMWVMKFCVGIFSRCVLWIFVLRCWVMVFVLSGD